MHSYENHRLKVIRDPILWAHVTYPKNQMFKIQSKPQSPLLRGHLMSSQNPYLFYSCFSSFLPSSSSSLPANYSNWNYIITRHTNIKEAKKHTPFLHCFFLLCKPKKWPSLHHGGDLRTSPFFLTKPHSHEPLSSISHSINSILTCIPYLLWSSGFSVASKRKKTSKTLTRFLKYSPDSASMNSTSPVRVPRVGLIGIGRRGRIFPRGINSLERRRWPLLFATWIRYLIIYNCFCFWFMSLTFSIFRL